MDENRNVPYIVYESAMVRAERTIKKLTIVALVALVLMFITNLAWIYEWTMFDTYSYSYAQDGQGVNNVNLGTQGDVLNGTESTDQSETETERK